MPKKKKAKAKIKKVKVVRKAVKKPVKKAKTNKIVSKKKKVVSKKASLAPKGKNGKLLEKIGEVTHYFPKVKAAAVMILKNSLKVGDEIYLKGYTTDFKERIASIQLDHLTIQEGKKGDEIGLLVKSRVRIGDSVYRI